MINQLVPKETLEAYSETENWFNYQDFYTRAAKAPEYKTYVEVGVWKGHSLRHLVSELQKSGKEEFYVYAVDLWDRLPKDNELWEKYPEQLPILRSIYNYNLIKSNTRKDVFDMICESTEAASKFKDETIDFCFIDASHDYEAAKKDLEAWFPKVRKNGVFAGHDIHHEPVWRAVHEFFDEKKQSILSNDSKDTWAIIKGH